MSFSAAAAHASKAGKAGKAALAAVALCSSLSSAALAQSSGDGFLFGAPHGSLTLRGGWAGARAGSDVFHDMTSQLTVNKGDFSSLTGGVDLGFNLGSRTLLSFAFDASSVNKPSEYRDYIDNNDAAIRQTTRFERVPVTASIKRYLTAPGRTVGRFAWIPSRAALFVGAGGGAQYYKFQQQGDFIDFSDPNTLDVTTDHLQSSGWAATWHGLAGFDISLSPRWAVTTEGRYSWSKATLSSEYYSGYDPIDLSGFSTTVGFTVRF